MVNYRYENYEVIEQHVVITKQEVEEEIVDSKYGDKHIDLSEVH